MPRSRPIRASASKSSGGHHRSTGRWALEGAQVLPDGDDVATDPRQVAQRPGHLGGGLAQPHHDRGLGHQTGVGGPRQHRQAAGVAGGGTHQPLQPGHGLDVVVQHVGALVEDHRERRGVTLAVRDEDLDGHRRAQSPDRPDAGREVRRAPVSHVVAGHGGDDGVLEAHAVDRGGDPVGFGGIEGFGPAGVDEAEAAGPGAALAAQHERGRPLLPALVDVRAAGLLADGHEVQVAHDRFGSGGTPGRCAPPPASRTACGHRRREPPAPRTQQPPERTPRPGSPPIAVARHRDPPQQEPCPRVQLTPRPGAGPLERPRRPGPSRLCPRARRPAPLWRRRPRASWRPHPRPPAR